MKCEMVAFATSLVVALLRATSVEATAAAAAGRHVLRGGHHAMALKPSGPGWGQNPVVYPTGLYMEPRAPAHGYTEYGDDPPGSTFKSTTSACLACVQFYPTKKDGRMYHDDLYQDPDGGTWPQTCRAGPCNFRDPQVQPWGGMIGAGSEPYRDAFASWWKPPADKTCFTLDDVSWYTDCEEELLSRSENIIDVSRVCSYRHQLALPNSGIFAGVTVPYTRLDSSHEQCLATIAFQGKKFYDNSQLCDSDLQALTGCCDSLYGSLACMYQETSSKGFIASDPTGFSAYMTATQDAMSLFDTYCLPLCTDLCSAHPETDTCSLGGLTCEDCTQRGGLFDMGEKRCLCKAEPSPGKVPADSRFARTPQDCVAAAPLRKLPARSARVTSTTKPPPAPEMPNCPYRTLRKEMWKMPSSKSPTQ